MQKIIAAILLLAFTGQTFNQGFYYIDYLLDKADYVQNCVNKSRPKMHCNGKCLLMRKIEEQEKREQQRAPEMKLADKMEVLPTKNLNAAIPAPAFEQAEHHYILFNQGAPIDQPSAIFHPPGA